MSDLESVTFDIDGNPFHALTMGQPGRPLLLFLHGFPEYSGAWADLMPRFAGDWYCVAPDQRGYGSSWRPEGVDAYDIPKLVADAVATIKRFGNGRAAGVIGHDWGAAVAYALARYAAPMVNRLVILNGVHPVPFQREMARGGAQTEASQYIRWLRAEGSEAKLAADDFALMLSIFSAKMDVSWMTAEKQADYKAVWRDEAGVRAMVNWYRASPLVVSDPGKPIPPEELPKLDPATLRVTMPHLLIWGMRDTALLPDSYAGLEDLCDDLEIVEVEDADHWIVHQKPELVAAKVRAFLAPGLG